MKRQNFFLVIVFIFCCNTALRSEEIKKVKYGKVTLEELQMTTYDKDTSAEAVVLYQYAEFVPTQFQFVEHYRIKILKKTGTWLASQIFGGSVKSTLYGCTYNLENGKIVKTKLDKSSIFEERVVGDIYQTRVAMPNVKVGSVFEIYFTFTGIPHSYEVQKNIPVIYNAVLFPKHTKVDIRIDEIGTLGYSYKQNCTWISKDLPAFKGEPFITSDKDYRQRLEFEITSFNDAGFYYWSLGFFASSWGAVSKMFNENKYFGKAIGDFLMIYLNETADSIKLKSKNDEELAKNAFEAMKRITWNKQKACFISQELRKTYQLKSGNSADINLNLVVLLNKLGLKSYPVIFSTRDNGQISKFNPTLNKFNYVVAAVEIGPETKYLDATDEYLPYGLTTDKISWCWGLPINKRDVDLSVFIEPNKKDKESTYSNLTIDSIGNISGKVSIKRLDYNAVGFKNKLKLIPDHDTYIQELEAKNTGWNINNFNFVNLNDPYKDFVEEYDVSFNSSFGQSDVLMFKPLSFVSAEKNPFQKDIRSYPISFPQQTEYSSIVSIKLPTNYQISEIPKSIDIYSSDKSVRFIYQIQNIGNTISISTKFLVSKLHYEPYLYQSIRGVYEMMIQKQNESIILKKI